MIDLFAIFGSAVRARLILCLSKKPKNVSAIIQTCGLSQSAVSQHLKKLRQSGIVTAKKEGKEVRYELKYRKAARISQLLLSLQEEIS